MMSIKWNRCNNTPIIHLKTTFREMNSIHFMTMRHNLNQRSTCHYFQKPPQMMPLLNTSPSPLKEWARAVICTKYNYLEVKELGQEGKLPNTLVQYLLEGSVKIKTPHISKLDGQVALHRTSLKAINGQVETHNSDKQKTCQGPCEVIFLLQDTHI